MTTFTMDKRMEHLANLGNYELIYNFNKCVEVSNLKKLGFYVFLPKGYTFPQLCVISWKDATVEGNLSEIDLASPKLSQAQRLWIITQRANLKRSSKEAL